MLYIYINFSFENINIFNTVHEFKRFNSKILTDVIKKHSPN